jgi:hypothetical protein
MNNKPPLNRIELINSSLRCFTLGVFSLLPIIGLPIAAMVLARIWSIRRRSKGIWNPAERYLHWSGIFASWGAGFSSLAAVVFGMFTAIYH